MIVQRLQLSGCGADPLRRAHSGEVDAGSPPGVRAN
jgi:hypothetical protein